MNILNFRILRQVFLVSAVFVLLVALGMAYLHRNASYSVDDSFITYRYALNALQGSGLVFNVGENYYGTTAAGYAALLALLAEPLFALFPELTMQNVSVGVSAFSMMMIGACWWIMLPKGREKWMDTFLLWLMFILAAFVSVPFNEAAGHETYAFLALALLSTVLAAREYMIAAGLFLGLAATFRPDAALMAPIIGLISMVMFEINWRRAVVDIRLLRFAGAFLSVLLPWLVYLQVHFGRVFPGTMDAKRAQVAMGYWPLYKPAALTEYVTTTLISPVLIAVLAGSALLIGYGIFSRTITELPRSRKFPPLYVGACWLLFTVLSTAFYFSIDVTFWRWYGIPIVLGLFVTAYAGVLCWLASDISHTPGAESARTLVLLLIAAAFVSLMAGHLDYWVKHPQVNQHIYSYYEVADRLKKLEPDGATVAMAEPGAFAVRLGSKFKVLDELGLVSPGVAKAYLKGDDHFLYRQYQPQYIVCSWAGKYSGCGKPDVIAAYTLIGEFDRDFWQQYLGHGVQLYRLKTSADKTVEQGSDGTL